MIERYPWEKDPANANRLIPGCSCGHCTYGKLTKQNKLVTAQHNRLASDRLEPIGIQGLNRVQTMEQWIKLAFAWLFLMTVLVSGLIVFGALLVSVGIVRGITTTYGCVKNLTKHTSGRASIN